jgi:hypothetical protein
MPICKVEVLEYQCFQCGYKWTNRVNGIDGPIPKRCSKCKKLNWNRRGTTPEEIGLRRRISYLEILYRSQSSYWGLRDNNRIDWPVGLSDKFLNLDPRPTVEELHRVLYGPEIALRLDSQNQCKRRGYVPDPTKPGWLKYNKEEYKKLLKQQAQKQQELMQQIITSRLHRGISANLSI